MTDPRHEQELVELAALYALEALGDEAQHQFTRSLETASASTREEVAAFQDVVQELAFSGPAIAPPASLKERLMARIAQEPQDAPEATGFTFVRSKGLPWQELAPGLSMKVLFHDAAAARTTMLLRLAPGGTLIGHRHPQVEELYVLEGSCLCAGEFLQVGDYHRAEAGTVHPVTSSEQGCLALIMTSSKNEPIR
ncbi:MAG: Cupin7 domain-containing protein [Nitrospira sp.]|nr:MAG: Cupin7 domain-containing protein [Nitrospira sp.]